MWQVHNIVTKLHKRFEAGRPYTNIQYSQLAFCSALGIRLLNVNLKFVNIEVHTKLKDYGKLVYYLSICLYRGSR